VDYLVNMASAGNTTNPAFYILRKKGYDLTVQERGNGLCHYIAVKERRRFIGDSAPELLGLVAIWEELGDNWRERLSDLPFIDFTLIEAEPESEEGDRADVRE
jgi:hypothetical protein